jgi:hypothetical protein
MAAIARITGGNFRLVHHLFSPNAQILRINALQTITQEAVKAARAQLVILKLRTVSSASTIAEEYSHLLLKITQKTDGYSVKGDRPVRGRAVMRTACRKSA